MPYDNTKRHLIVALVTTTDPRVLEILERHGRNEKSRDEYIQDRVFERHIHFEVKDGAATLWFIVPEEAPPAPPESPFNRLN